MNARQLITAAVAAATLGMSTATLARDDDRRQRHDGPRHEQRHGDRQGDRFDNRRGDRHVERHVYNQAPRYVHRDVRIVHRDNGYRAYGPRWQRGHYLPREYRSQRHVVVNYRHHPRLYQAPRGHQWVQVNGEFLLVAVATGLIAHALFSN
jgi:Ni/Co efflux regulator RcnB